MSNMKQGFAARWLAALTPEQRGMVETTERGMVETTEIKSEPIQPASSYDLCRAYNARQVLGRADTPPLDDRSMPHLALSPQASISVLVLARTEAELTDFVRRNPSTEREVSLVKLANPDKRHGSYAVVANRFIAERSEDIVGIIHCDTTFGEGVLRDMAIAARDEGGQITGMVGRALNHGYVWSRDGGGLVSTLDCCAIFFPRAFGFRFDEATFDDFHCMVEDLSLQAAACGIRTYVPSTGLSDHHGWGVWFDPKWGSNHGVYRRRLAAKWPKRRFITACDLVGW